MEISGFLAEDAPDPRFARLAMIEGLGIPVAGLVPQPHLENRGEAGYSASGGRGSNGMDDVTISQTYLLWRRPEHRDDPVNLADLDAETSATVAAALERPVPDWLLEARRLLHYPHLWDAVQTHWTAPGSDRPTVAERLVAHAEHVLTNSFREQLGLEPGSWAPRIPPTALQPHDVAVDGVARPGLLLDTDPFVLAVGCGLDDGRVVTVVLDRDAVPLVRLELLSSAPIRP